MIAHQDCAFYTEQLGISAAALETRQREDVQTAARRLRALAANLRVDLFFARKGPDGTIHFQPIAQ